MGAEPLPENCDLQRAQANETTACVSRPDAAFAEMTDADLLALDVTPVPADSVLQCGPDTDLARIERAGLSPAQLAHLDQHTLSTEVLVDATIDDVRYLYHADPTQPLQWKANPDRVVLTLPGRHQPITALLDVGQGPTSYCMESRVFVTHAREATAAAVQIQSTPPSQEVEVGSTAFLQIKIINSGTTPLAPVTVTSSDVGPCARTVASLGAGFTYTYTCSKPNVQAPFSNTVTATGTSASTTVSASATSTVTLPGGGDPGSGSGAAPYVVCRVPWVQYAKVGETARWQMRLNNWSDSPLNAVSITDTAVAGCSNALASVAVGATIIWTCSVPIGAGPSVRVFTTRSSSRQPSGLVEQDWSFTNVVITDYLFVGGFDGCVANGTSAELCFPDNATVPQMRRATP